MVAGTFLDKVHRVRYLTLYFASKNYDIFNKYGVGFVIFIQIALILYLSIYLYFWNFIFSFDDHCVILQGAGSDDTIAGLKIQVKYISGQFTFLTPLKFW